MSKFTFHELVIGMFVGDVKDGDELVTSKGSKVIYKYGVLSWVTQSGYISSSVSVTNEIMMDTFTRVTELKTKFLTFGEALEYLAEGDTVFAKIEGREYELSTFDDLDDLIEDKEFFIDLYKATFSVPIEVTATEELPFSDAPEEATEVEPAKMRQGIKITASEAWEILHQYHFMGYAVPKIADNFGVSGRMIYYIIDGTHWNAVYKDFHTEFDVVTEDYIK